MKIPTIKQSPLPWQDNDAGLIYGKVSGDDDAAPFVCDVCDSPLEYTGQEKANAAFIVRACNAYGDMLEALEFVAMTFADMEASRRFFSAEAREPVPPLIPLPAVRWPWRAAS